jgi:ATP-binding cassette subfamily F protein 3
MLQVSGIYKHFGGESILERVSFLINDGERIGLVGPNGCGKTTLLRIIIGQEPPDRGSVQLSPPTARVGYLAQSLEYAPGETVGEVLWKANEGLHQARERLQALAAAMAAAADAEAGRLLTEYGRAQEQFERLGGYDLQHRIEAILDGLRLRGLDAETPVAILSGGQKTRLGLARLLVSEPQLLLLDEPTNHLDIQALEWLEGFLSHYPGGMIIVSHDRTFLDNTVTSVLELDAKTHTIKEYPGAYSDYAAAQERELGEQWRVYKDQQERMDRLSAEIREWRGHSMRVEKTSDHFYYRKIAKQLARHALVQERRLQRMLDSEDRVDKPQPVWTMKLEFGNVPPSGQNVLMLQGLGMAYSEHPLFREVNLTLRYGERIALTGPNGAGQTTLLKIVAGQLAPSEGSVQLGANVRLGYYSQEQENLNPDSTPLAEIRALAPLYETETRSFLHYFLFAGDDVFTPVGKLSYGERARLALARLVVSGCNLLLLDEPINHLDIPSRENFERALSQYQGTVLIIVHDRYFIRRFATGVWKVENGAIHRYIDLDTQ